MRRAGVGEEEGPLPTAEEEIEITRMGEGDVEQVAEIERRSYVTPWSPHAFLSEIRDNSYAHYIVARAGGQVIGYAGMWLIFDEAHITNIAVHPDHRSRGVGNCLLTELERLARERGILRMTLEVRPSNPAAQALYAKHGFEPRGRRRGYYSDTGEDAVIMWKDSLDPSI